MLQENQQSPFPKKKFTQKPIGVIFWLWLFFPVGIYFMWKEKMWSSKTRIIITSVFSIIIIVGLAGKNGNTNRESNSSNSITYTNNLQNDNSTDQTIRVDYTIKEETVWDATNNILELVWNVAKIHKSSQTAILTIYVDKKAIGLVDGYGKIIDETEKIEQISEDLNEIRKFNLLDDLQYGSFQGQLKFTEIANTIATGRKRWFLDGEKYGLW